MPITASPEISALCGWYIGPSSVTGVECYAAAAGPALTSPGTLSTRSKRGHLYSDQNCSFPPGRCRLSRCNCESTAEERGAGNPHATFCGNRRRATASGDPVGARSTSVPTAAANGGDRGTVYVANGDCTDQRRDFLPPCRIQHTGSHHLLPLPCNLG